ncbi:MAG: nucleoside-diphosphate kinase [Acidimicrobiales bacterium]
MDRTLVICKPDAVRRSLVGEVLGRFERRAAGWCVPSCAPSTPPRSPAYEARRQALLRRSRVLHESWPRRRSQVIEGPGETWKVVRQMLRTTDRWMPPGTIGDLGTEFTENLIHGSDSADSAAREIEIFFPSH